MAWLLGNMMMNHWIWDDLRKPSDVPPPLLLCDWRPPFGALRLDLRGASDVPLPGPSTWTEAPGHGTIHGTGRSMGPIGPTDFSKKVCCLFKELLILVIFNELLVMFSTLSFLGWRRRSWFEVEQTGTFFFASSGENWNILRLSINNYSLILKVCSSGKTPYVYNIYIYTYVHIYI